MSARYDPASIQLARPQHPSYRERMLHRPLARERSEKPRSELTLLALNAIIVILAVTAFTLAAFSTRACDDVDRVMTSEHKRR